ncbi:MAG: hybrid sensor histidine kinase/response regulator [Cytophagales bacterium]|nr:MAG: hybrid sensor histidine kinase/response regulator [Cytophagales bacterium]
MNHTKIKVLYLDDEPSNLGVFKAGFRFNFDIYTATNAKEALEILHSHDIHVIIADQKMPQITGVEFFSSILNEFPNPIRILLTGYADIEAVIAAINTGQVYRYLKKPWNTTELILTIENAYEAYLATKAVHDLNEQLTKTNEELNRFVYSASHDLKAPIMSILGLLKVAELEGDKKDPEKYFSMINSSVKQLDTFIHNIINYYKNTRLQEARDEIDFEKIIKETINSYEYIENKPDTKIALNVLQTLPFYSDEFRIRVLFNNLISNAIKYQRKEEPNKKIDIECSVNQLCANIKISDNGIGIKKEYIPNIFKMFYRATRESTGSGIGLYIVKEAVDKVNGSIEVNSEENIGTSFSIKIPNRKQPA